MDKGVELRPVIIGITGGIGSGKSTVARMLAELGADLVDADAIAHEVLRRDDVKDAVRSEWGPDIFGLDGEVDREALARLVFADGGRIERLEAIVHPPVIDRIRRQLVASTAPAVVIDAPLLTESKLNEQCDAVVFVEAPEDERRRRMKNRGWPADELRNRGARQQPLIEKRKLSQYVIENGNSLSATQEQVVEFWNENIKRNGKQEEK